MVKYFLSIYDAQILYCTPLEHNTWLMTISLKDTILSEFY